MKLRIYIILGQYITDFTLTKSEILAKIGDIYDNKEKSMKEQEKISRLEDEICELKGKIGDLEAQNQRDGDVIDLSKEYYKRDPMLDQNVVNMFQRNNRIGI